MVPDLGIWERWKLCSRRTCWKDGDRSLDLVSEDEKLTPLGRLDKYAASENVFNRYVGPPQ